MECGIANKSGHAMALSRKIEKMQRQESGQDFIIEVEGQKFPVHRMLLIACSDYFKAMLSTDMQEAKEGVARMKEIESESVSLCLGYMYTGEAPVTMDNIHGVFRTADMWQFKELSRQCANYLERNITIQHCLDVKFIAEEFLITRLVNLAEQYAVENFDEIIHSRGFKSLKVCELLDLIKKSRERTKVIWKAVMTWVQAREEDSLSQELFDCFDFTGCSFKFLYETVWKEPLVAENECYRKAVAEKLLPLVESSNLTAMNCFEFLNLAKSFEDQSCRGKVYKYIAENLEEVSSGLPTLDITDITEIFVQCNWDEETQHLWSVYRRWVKADKEKTRRTQVIEILNRCVLPHSNFNFLYNTLIRDSLIKNTSANMHLVLSELFLKMKLSDVSKSNWPRLLELTRRNALYRMKTRHIITEYIAQNLKTLFGGSDFQKINDEVFPDVVGSIARASRVIHSGGRLLRVRLYSGPEIWKTVRMWIAYEEEDRKRHIKKLLHAFNLQQFSFGFVFGTLYNDAWVRADTSVKEYVTTVVLLIVKPSDLNPGNCFDLLQITDISKSSDVLKAKETILEFMRENFQAVSKVNGFISLSNDNFFQVLISGNSNGQDKWDGSIKWVRANPESRKEHLPTILKEVHLEKMSRNFIRTKVFTDSLVKESEVCKTMIIEALLVDDSNVTENERVDSPKQQQVSAGGGKPSKYPYVTFGDFS